jgi:peptide/nickel transport system substrate-binding protein
MPCFANKKPSAGGSRAMQRHTTILASAFLALAGLFAGTAAAQKAGGVLRIYHRDSPASMSIHEEGTIGVIMPMMGVMNNLMIYDQHIARNELGTIRPELATSWAWSADGTALTFQLRDGVRWHDGKPFTADDVKCTFDLLAGQGKEKLRLNYRASWWINVAGTSVNGPHEATLHLKRPQPAILALLASGEAPMYPCHVSPRDMRLHPIGTGPFRFVEYPEPFDGAIGVRRRQVRHDISQ